MDWLEDELKFEDELRKALQRQEPSPDFEARVTSTVRSKVTAAAGQRRPVFSRPLAPGPRPLSPVPWPLGLMPRWLATAAAVLVITSAGAGYRYHRGHVAKEQVMFAMRLAGSQLNRIQMQMKAVRP